MTTDPIEFLKTVLPELFNGAAKDLQALASQGDADAKSRHAELVATEGAVRVLLEGKGGADLYLMVKGGTLTVVDKTPSVDVLVAVAVPAEAAELGLEELHDDVQRGLPKLRKRLLGLSAKKAKAFLDRVAAEKLRFHHVLKDTPDFDEVRVKVAIGDREPPQKPTFTVTIDYDVFEELRAGKVKPQALMSKLQLSGDASRAMQLGMELIQQLPR